MKRILVAIIGSGATDKPALIEAARAAGEAIARHGAVTVAGECGGVFGAAFAGARAAGGLTLALTGGDRVPEGHPVADVVLPTGLGPARHAVLAAACCGAVVIEGGMPTLALAAEFLAARKPVVVVAESGGAAGLLAGSSALPGGTRVLSAFDGRAAVDLIFQILGETNP
ncbi:MAG TPA: TIGR00725 family protein [Kiritimatiellia bacterium]|nr:TIGR00725 family protein [Kiritimatiellia bacterium]HRZ12683.1 TIGR00725 family protein [Kiritimatiellia bacterium]HSA19549.1 TIGR00725 family protein [Kiritimatiellia bacterium]